MKCEDENCGYSRDNDFTDPIVPALAIPTARVAYPQDNTGEAAGQALQDALNVKAVESPGWSSGTGELDISNPDVPIPDLTGEDLPSCPECKKAKLRPGVVWFGESLPDDTLDKVDEWVAKGPIDLVLVIGTSATVFPAVGYIDEGRDRGARVAIINMDRTHLPGSGMDPGDWIFEGDASVILPELLKDVIGEV